MSTKFRLRSFNSFSFITSCQIIVDYHREEINAKIIKLSARLFQYKVTFYGDDTLKQLTTYLCQIHLDFNI